MMGYGYSYGFSPMMGGWFGGLVCLILLIDLILVGVWLWKQINK